TELLGLSPGLPASPAAVPFLPLLRQALVSPAVNGFSMLLVELPLCAAERWRSNNSPQCSHLSAISLHTVLFSGLCVNSAMNSHSAANLRNFSEVFIGWSLCVASGRSRSNVTRSPSVAS